MSFNLVDLVKGQLGGPALGQLGALLGEDNNKTEAALGAAVPGLLSGLTSQANSDGGASLFDAVSNQDDSMLDNIGGLLTGGNSSSGMDQGSGAAGGLASAVAGLTGIGGKSSSGLMGLLMPIVLGMVKRKIFGGGGFSQNAGGLLSLLNGQKDNVQAAMPSGFQNQLQSSGFMDQMSNFGGNVGGAVSGAAGAVGNAAGNAADAVGDAGRNAAGAVGNAASNTADAAGNAASAGGGLLKKFLPIAILAAIALFALKLCTGGKDVDVPNASVPSVEVPSVDVGGVNVGDEIGGIFGGATDAIGGITDVDSANAALPALEEVSGKADGLTGIWDKVPEAARGPMSGLVGGHMDKLTPMLDKANEIPGVADVLGPVTGPLLDKLKAFM